MFKVEFIFEEDSHNDELQRRKAALIARRRQREEDQEVGTALTAINSLPQAQSTTIVETPLRKTRKKVASQFEEVEFSNNRQRLRKKAPANVRYLETKNKFKDMSFTPNKFGWIVCFGLFLRLIVMDNGVIDYYKMENHMQEKLHSLDLIKQENADLITEIHRIKTESAYQKKLAREHLGVIAADEFLILFAQETSAHSI